MMDPTALYLGNPALLGDDRLRGLPMIVALSGYVEAGHLAGQIEAVVLDSMPSETVARFDLDQLYDYRSRRPRVTFAEDHFEDWEAPELNLHLVTDGLDRHFLLLTGPEPDTQWERFAAAVVGLAQRLRVSLVAIVNGIPMPVPHTRPVLVTAHGPRADLLPRMGGSRPSFEVSASASHLLELRLQEHGIDHVGLSVHVPQYLAESYLPQAAVAALEHLSAVTGRTLPTDELREASRDVIRQIDEQANSSPEVQAVIESMERRYDDVVDASARRSILAGPDDSDLPDADDLGAAAEAFLAARNDSDGHQDQ
ncbi:PAC2 family protein [Kocuria rhizophila]|uniref:proteasome assembly chaperone family protein n=1 Tax=Kocuria TaxID=57493 RepID=UPI000EB3EBFC|nr:MULTISPECIES: PAC2 family protein [Kocuria]WIW68401.1 PAC2 family protein [Kocuria sp. ChxB]MCR4525649.1 PAC2 family protein [Kocuria rhizophila]MCT1545205.1 PAC2 family protein [Kocuria rhizophila]MCT2171624.1 PAC2 family protein [Kocuria rhizophila]MDA4828901.1 PAC2 family protein [Kocuria rhizophila]